MKRRIPLLTVLIPALLLLFTGPAGGESAGRKLTLMVYMCGSNLESTSGAATEDIREMMAAVPESGLVSVLVMTGGSDTRETAGFFSPSAVEIHEISAGRSRMVWASDGPLSMGSGDTLEKLLDYGAAYYPAEEYALILWNHGGGPLEGVCRDELFSMEPLGMADLTRALRSHPWDKLSWIGFDACLMASVEVAAFMSPFAHYMIASQESEPSSGWDYSFLREIGEDTDGAATGKRIADCYFRSLEESREILTLSCLNLDRFGEVLTGMDSFFSAAAEKINEDTFSRFSEIRLAAASAGKGTRGPGNRGYDLADLADLIGHFDIPHEELDRALEAAVVYSRSTREGLHGLSVYHPYVNKEQYAEKWKTAYQKLHFCDGYTRYLTRFGTFLTEAPVIDWSGLRTETSGYDGEGIHHFSLQLTPEQQADCVSAQLLILRDPGDNFSGYGKDFAMVFAAEAGMEDTGRLTASYDNRILSVADRENRPLIRRISFSLEDGVVAVSALCFDNSGGNNTKPAADVIYCCAEKAGTGDLEILQRQVYDPATGHYTNRLAFSEDGYSDLYFRFEPRTLPDPDKALPAFPLWEDSQGVYMDSVRLPEEWHFRFLEDQHPGSLYAVFQVTDSRQNTYSSLPVPLENSQEHPLAVSPETLETEAWTLRLSAGVNRGNESPGLNLDFDFTGKTDREQTLKLTRIVVNGTRCIPDFHLSTLAAGERKKIRFSPYASDLTGVDEIRRIDAVLEMTDSDDMRITKRFPVSLTLEACDLSWFAKKKPPALDECEQDGILWQLLSLEITPDNCVEGLIYLENHTAEPFEVNGALCLNHVMVSRYFFADNHTKIPPGTGFCLPFRVRNTLQLSFLAATVESRFNEWYAGIGSLLEGMGVRAIEEVNLYYNLNKYTEGVSENDLVTLTLPEPVPLSGEAGIPDCRTLLDGEISAEIVQAFAADDSVSLLLRFSNRTNRAVTLRMENAHLNGKDALFTYYLDYFSSVIPARTQVLEYVTIGTRGLFRKKAGLNEADFLFRLPGGAGAGTRILFPEGTSFGADGGTLLPAKELEVRPLSVSRSIPALSGTIARRRGCPAE